MLGEEAPVPSPIAAPAPAVGTVTARGARQRVLFMATAAAAFLVALTIILELGVSERPSQWGRPRQWVSLEEPGGPAAGAPAPRIADEPVLRVAVAAGVSPEKSVELYRPFVEYLAARLGRSPVFLQRPTYGETNELLRRQRCDVGFVSTCAFLRAEREFGLKALAVPQTQGALACRALVLAPSASRATSLLDFRGRRFASADLLSTSGWLYPAVWLKEHREDPDHFFGENVITGSHDRSIQAVALRYVDGAAVSGLVYDRMIAEDPALADQVRIVQESEPFPAPPVVVDPQLPDPLREQVQAALLSAHEDPAGREILRRLGIERFVVPREGFYDQVRRMAEALETRSP